VVVVVVGCEVVGAVVDPLSLLPDEPDVVVVVDASDTELAPGCSLETSTPINAVAAAATRMAARVNRRRSECARRRASGVCSLGYFMSHDGLIYPACIH
jgi:hypothetical protein